MVIFVRYMTMPEPYGFIVNGELEGLARTRWRTRLRQRLDAAWKDLGALSKNCELVHLLWLGRYQPADIAEIISPYINERLFVVNLNDLRPERHQPICLKLFQQPAHYRPRGANIRSDAGVRNVNDGRTGQKTLLNQRVGPPASRARKRNSYHYAHSYRKLGRQNVECCGFNKMFVLTCF